MHYRPTVDRRFLRELGIPLLPRNGTRRWIAQRRAELLVADPACYFCRVPLTRKTATLDHYYPKSKGGLTTRANTVLACLECNLNKADAVPEDAT